MSRSRWIAFLCPALVVAHFLLHVGLGLSGAAPDLLTLAVLLGAREWGMGVGAGLGFGLGLLEDSFALLTFGSHALSLTIVGALGAKTRDLFVGESALFYFWFLAAGKLLREILFWIFASGAQDRPVGAVLFTGTLAALYGAAVVTALLLPVRREEGRLP